MSTPSPGMSNSAVAVEPSETVIVVGSNVIPVMVVVLHGLAALIVIEEVAGEKDEVQLLC